MGLVEWEWLETLSTIDPDAVTFRDYVEVGNELAKQLRDQVLIHFTIVLECILEPDYHRTTNSKNLFNAGL